MSDTGDDAASGAFSSTKWTLVIRVIQEGNEEAAAKAVADFCLQYRPAIYRFIRRREYSHERAEDLVQEFFEKRILGKWGDRATFVHRADRSRGKFRSFLSQVVIRFLQDKTKAGNAIAAGGRFDHVSVEALAEAGHSLPGSVEANCGREFDLEFARRVIELATQTLKHSEHHLAVLIGKKRQAQIAQALGMTEETFKVNHHRFRRRFGEAIREVVKNSIGDDEHEVNEEIRYLMSLFEGAL